MDRQEIENCKDSLMDDSCEWIVDNPSFQEAIVVGDMVTLMRNLAWLDVTCQAAYLSCARNQTTTSFFFIRASGFLHVYSQQLYLLF